MSDNPVLQGTYDMNVLREPILKEVIGELCLAKGSNGLDNGCGIGLQCLTLAGEVGPTGTVTGLDISQELLAHAREIAEKAGLSDRITFREGDISALPFDSGTFDWTLSIDCVGYGPWKTTILLGEMARVVKPGGTIAIAAWSSEKLLPGFPELEARLKATAAGIAPFVRGKEPGLHFNRALGWFRELGMKECRAKAFVGSVYAPLSDRERRALASLIEMRWPGVESELSTEDSDKFRRLCTPDSNEYILDLPDYYAQFTYTLFYGKK